MRAVTASLDTTQRSSALPGPGDDAVGFACLVVIRGEPFARKFEIRREPVIIGRSSSCDVQVGNTSVSRQHCRIWFEGENYHIQDLGSTNRTLINGRPIDNRPLANGDRVTVGETVLKFVLGDDVEAVYHEELYTRATEDPLTGIGNRRLFEEALARELALCRQHGTPLSLTIVDIDNFKDINDRFDHATGDAALCQLGALLTEHGRDVDTVARLGGEEFGVIEPGLEVAEAARRAEALRARIEASTLACEGHALTMTVSIGVAEMTGEVDAPTLFKLADRALMRAKQEGRNRVCVSAGET